jgi:hypothetical protein
MAGREASQHIRDNDRSGERRRGARRVGARRTATAGNIGGTEQYWGKCHHGNSRESNRIARWRLRRTRGVK